MPVLNPPATPVTTPVALPIDAIVGDAALHVPPPVALLRVRD